MGRRMSRDAKWVTAGILGVVVLVVVTSVVYSNKEAIALHFVQAEATEAAIKECHEIQRALRTKYPIVEVEGLCVGGNGTPQEVLENLYSNHGEWLKGWRERTSGE